MGHWLQNCLHIDVTNQFGICLYNMTTTDVMWSRNLMSMQHLHTHTYTHTHTRTHTHTPAKSSWTRFLPKILTNLPKILPNLPKTFQDLAQGAKIMPAKVLSMIWRDLILLARSRPPAKILLFLARILPKNFLLGPDP